MTIRNDAIAFFAQRLGTNGVLADAVDQERYVRDWAGAYLGMPLAVVRPGTTEEVAEHGIGRSKQAAYLARLSTTERRRLAGIKEVFDPDALMGVGRILPLTERQSLSSIH